MIELAIKFNSKLTDIQGFNIIGDFMIEVMITHP